MRRLCGLLVILHLAGVSGADVTASGLRAENRAAFALQQARRVLVVRDLSMWRETDFLRRVEELLVFCRQKDVGVVLLAFPTPAAASDLRLQRRSQWVLLSRRAHQQGLAVWALAGDLSWSRDVGQALRWADELLAIHRQGWPGGGLDGVVVEYPALSQLTPLRGGEVAATPARAVDQTGTLAPDSVGPSPALDPLLTEPPLLWPTRPESLPSDDNRNGALLSPADLNSQLVVRSFLEQLSGFSSYLQNAARLGSSRALGNLRIGVALPAWLRGQVSWQGQLKPASDHFADLCDLLLLHNLPAATTEIAAAADATMQYAGQAGKLVVLRLELGLPPRPVPALISLHRRDEVFLESTIAQVLARHARTAGFAGIALDDFLSYRNLPELLDDGTSPSQFAGPKAGAW
ncbi:MAG: hypothetical protein IT204_23150 [Fimbriimonadaceae bacterium]|nr:hypothetical protein [Fimbriimonadaceae bacterium]